MKILSAKMRDIKQLLSSQAGCDRISDYTFRSADEVTAYTAGLADQVTVILNKLTRAAKFPVRASVRVDPIQGIDQSKLAACYSLLNELQQKVEILQSLEVTISHNFRNNRAELVKNIQSLHKRIVVQRNKALNQLERMARDREPPKFNKLVERAVKSLEKRFKKKFKSVKQYTYLVSGKEPGSVMFNHYVEFDELVNNHQDYVYPEYYVVFSAVVSDKGLMRTYVNSLHEFRAPGDFSIGAEYDSDKACDQAVDAILLADEFIDQVARQSITLTNSDINVQKLQTRNVESVIVIDNKLRVQTTDIDPEQAKSIAKSLIRDITGILLPHQVKGALKYKMSRIGKTNRYHVDFVVVPMADRIGLDNEHEILLRSRLGMDDHQIKQVRKLLSKGHL